MGFSFFNGIGYKVTNNNKVKKHQQLYSYTNKQLSSIGSYIKNVAIIKAIVIILV